MTSMTLDSSQGHEPGAGKPQLESPKSLLAMVAFAAVLTIGLGYMVFSLYQDISSAGMPTTTWLPFILLGIALLTALGFEFVNGFHDTANAVATVIYTNAMPANFAVVWSGFFNFLGVMVSTGAVAFGIISLLPVELILNVGSGAGFAMVFALLIAAILWNLGTWALGLPASSSHTLIGSIIGVGLANQLFGANNGTSGVDWSKAVEIGYSLLLSPLVGFIAAALLFLTIKVLIKNPELYSEPKGNKPPPLWIRGLLVATCTGVSFAHGSNDGQKGMGLIMLILIGCAPTAYALNRAISPADLNNFRQTAIAASAVIDAKAGGHQILGDPRPIVTRYVAERQINESTFPALAALTREIVKTIETYGSPAKFPAAAVGNARNDMYLASEALRFIFVADKKEEKIFTPDDLKVMQSFKSSLDNATKFIPFWVKVVVALALGLGTMVGWKRIVVTVGEKIGKTHLTYAQGASAELVAAATIFAADNYGLPVSTTHILSSGVAGTMAANKSGLQMSTVRNLLMAWVLTLPCAILISGTLFVVLRAVF
ncbi:inorganic phosphate transporter [Bosea sp. BK604]|uniref:inorganic phosphate transporter n=1 Tax=Bosea sp. BK604 TaxID=2512180 RepID=UPI0010446D79|nr:inorganic phosphate transporter [Bosea sp. BK604]TCR62069.1 PiT family inorganic phosphate transporter [Bosea sp. BK604]